MTTYLDQVFASQPPRNRQDIIEAAGLAGTARIRPAFMTAVPTILALLPIFMIGGTGKEIMRPPAIPARGGMLRGVISWFFVPCLYSWWQERTLLKSP